MKMSASYMGETVGHLAAHGFEAIAGPIVYGEQTGTRFELVREHSHLVLEVLRSPSGAVQYFLELKNHFGLRVTSYPLDSWKHFSDRVEFKFQVDAQSAMGLSFVLALSPAVAATKS